MTGVKYVKFCVYCTAVNVSADSMSKFHKQFSREALIINEQLGEKEVGGQLITFLSRSVKNSVLVTVCYNLFAPRKFVSS